MFSALLKKMIFDKVNLKVIKKLNLSTLSKQN
jgi:hypothetical protein